MSAATTKAQIGVLEKNGMKAKNAPEGVISKMKEIGQAMMKEWRKKQVLKQMLFWTVILQ